MKKNQQQKYPYDTYSSSCELKGQINKSIVIYGES